jgi:hypothetical protein
MKKVFTESLQDIIKNGLVASFSVPIQNPGAYQMRIAIRDEQSSRVDSASQYIEVPDLNKKRLALSGIFLGNAETQQVKVFNTATIVLNQQRDAATRRFRSGSTIRFDMSVYNAKVDKSNNQPRLAMQYKIFRDNQEIFTTAEKAISFVQFQNSRNIDISGAFMVGSNMLPGDYVLQVIVKDLLAKEKRQIATQWIDFEVTK